VVKKANSKVALGLTWREMNKGLPTLIRIGKCYVFMRAGHQWHSDIVAVIVQTSDGLTVARASDVCEQLLSPVKRRRTFETWTAQPGELW